MDFRHSDGNITLVNMFNYAICIQILINSAQQHFHVFTYILYF